MRRTTPTLCALAAAGLLLAGCGSQSGKDAGGSAGTVSPSATPTHTGCAPLVQLGAADSGRTVCVAKGGEVRLALDGTKSRPWKPVTARGSALKGINAGFVVQPGQATAAYQAVAPGTVQLASTRPLCPAASPGQVSCKGVQEWTVTVKVQ